MDNKIDESQLYKNVSIYTSSDFSEKFLRTGNFVLNIVLQYIYEMCYSIGSNKEDESRRLANLRKTLEEYYAEVKGGMDPKNTKMQFTFSWDYPQFKGHVEVNNDVSKRKK